MQPLPALLVATAVVLVALIGTGIGVRELANLDAGSNRALLATLPLVVLCTGMLFPLAQRLESGGSGRRRRFRRSLVVISMTAAACALVVVVEIVVFGKAIDDSTVGLIVAMVVFAAPMFVVPGLFDRRFPRPAEADEPEPSPGRRR